MAGYGFVPAYHATGGVIRAAEYTIGATLASNLFSGDMVQLAGGLLTLGTATSTDNIGIFYGVQYTDENGGVVFRRYWPTGGNSAWTNIKAYVYDDPYIIFRVQADQVSTALLSTDIGDGFDVAPTAGSVVTGQSGFVLNSDLKTTDQFRLVGSAEVDGTFSAAGTTMDVYVRFLDHVHRTVVAVA